MLTLLAIVHCLIGLALILFVLLQDPKGGAMGVFSGGSSSTSFFGSSGASNFLTKTTTWLAILFAASCMTLTYLTAKKGGSVMDAYSAPATTAPAVPGAPDPATGVTPLPEEAKTPPAATSAPNPADSPKK